MRILEPILASCLWHTCLVALCKFISADGLHARESTPNILDQFFILRFAVNVIPNHELPDPINEIRAMDIGRI